MVSLEAYTPGISTLVACLAFLLFGVSALECRALCSVRLRIARDDALVQASSVLSPARQNEDTHLVPASSPLWRRAAGLSLFRGMGAVGECFAGCGLLI